MELRNFRRLGAARWLAFLALIDVVASTVLTQDSLFLQQHHHDASRRAHMSANSLWSGEKPVHAKEPSANSASQSAMMLRTSMDETAQMIRSCELHFDSCWQQDSGAWAGTQTCGSTASVCQNVLCTTFLEANCTSMVSSRMVVRCAAIENMCMALVHPGGLSRDQDDLMVPSSGAVRLSSTDITIVQDALDELQEPPAESSREAREADNPGSSQVTLLHIPKTGGTAIEEAGIVQKVHWGMYLMQGRTELARHGEWRWFCQLYHTPPALLKDRSIYEDSETFCVTRHPYERAISEYTYMLSVPWGDDIPEAGRCEPSSLNSYLQEKLRYYSKGPYMKYMNDCHFIPQSEYIWGKGRRWCHDIFRFDDFPEKFNLLMRSKGSAVRVNPDHKVNAFHDICPNMNVSMLNEETLALLQDVYANDFEPLGYSKDGGYFDTDYSTVPPDPEMKRAERAED